MTAQKQQTGPSPTRERPRAALRYGVTPAGLVFTQQPAQAEDAARTLDLLRDLRGAGRLVVRLNRLYWSGGDTTLDRIRSECTRYAREGFEVSLQLRYGGPGEHLPAGGPDAFAAWTRQVVAATAGNDRVIGVEVTNEANLAIAPDNSDGAFDRVGDALVGAVIAASEEARKNRSGPRPAIGFNWFHHTGPDAEEVFWSHLRTRGGERFASALDWVGLNVYPATYDFLDIEPGREPAEIERALARLRDDYLPAIFVPAATPIRVTELGWPDGHDRTEQQQAQRLAAMVTAIDRARAHFNVTHLYWFDLRDSDSARPENESHYGLVRSDYVKKDAFDVFRRFVHGAIQVGSVEQ